MTRQDQFDGGTAQRFDNVEILFSRHAENAVNALIFEGGHQQI
jgi:hypothetical protein